MANDHRKKAMGSHHTGTFIAKIPSALFSGGSPSPPECLLVVGNAGFREYNGFFSGPTNQSAGPNEKRAQKWGTWGRSGWAAAAGAGASRARAWDDRLRGGALGGPLRARFAAQRNRGGASDAPIVGGGGVRCGGPGLARLAAAGRAPRLRRTAEACRQVASFPCAPSRRAGGGIAAAPRVRTG